MSDRIIFIFFCIHICILKKFYNNLLVVWTDKKADHLLGHLESLENFQRLENLCVIFSDPNAVKLELQSVHQKLLSTLKFQYILLNNSWDRKNFKRNITVYLQMTRVLYMQS